MQNKNYKYTILTVIPQLKHDLQHDRHLLIYRNYSLPHSSNQSENWMQSENYEYTILTVIPQLKLNSKLNAKWKL